MADSSIPSADGFPTSEEANQSSNPDHSEATAPMKQYDSDNSSDAVYESALEDLSVSEEQEEDHQSSSSESDDGISHGSPCEDVSDWHSLADYSGESDELGVQDYSNVHPAFRLEAILGTVPTDPFDRASPTGSIDGTSPSGSLDRTSPTDSLDGTSPTDSLDRASSIDSLDSLSRVLLFSPGDFNAFSDELRLPPWLRGASPPGDLEALSDEQPLHPWMREPSLPGGLGAFSYDPSQSPWMREASPSEDLDAVSYDPSQSPWMREASPSEDPDASSDEPRLPLWMREGGLPSDLDAFADELRLLREALSSSSDFNSLSDDLRLPAWMREASSVRFPNYRLPPYDPRISLDLEEYLDLLDNDPLTLISVDIFRPPASPASSTTSESNPNKPRRRYRTMETAANKLQKEAKGYLDSLRAMTASQMRIAETIDAFYGDAGTKDGVSRSYKQAVTDLDAETIKALDGPYRTTVLDPIQRFCSYFPDINACITKREHKQMDYDRMRAQVKKLTDKPDKDVTKLPRAEKDEQLARAAYDQLNDTLTSELPQLIDLRVPYLDPSFEALVKIQLRFCAEAYSRMAQVQQYLDANTRDQYAQGELDARVEEVLQEIRDLSIAGTV